MLISARTSRVLVIAGLLVASLVFGDMLSATEGTEPAAVQFETSQPQTGQGADRCQEAMNQLGQQEDRLAGELRIIRRDIAALNQNLEKPGIRDAMAGVGYILGLFGAASLVASRRRKRTQEG